MVFAGRFRHSSILLFIIADQSIEREKRPKRNFHISPIIVFSIMKEFDQ